MTSSTVNVLGRSFVCPGGPRTDLAGGLCLQGLEPGGRQHRHQRGWGARHPPRADAAVGAGAPGRARLGAGAGRQHTASRIKVGLESEGRGGSGTQDHRTKCQRSTIGHRPDGRGTTSPPFLGNTSYSSPHTHSSQGLASPSFTPTSAGALHSPRVSQCLLTSSIRANGIKQALQCKSTSREIRQAVNLLIHHLPHLPLLTPIWIMSFPTERRGPHASLWVAGSRLVAVVLGPPDDDGEEVVGVGHLALLK